MAAFCPAAGARLTRIPYVSRNALDYLFFVRLMLNDSYCARSLRLVIFPTSFFEVGTDTTIAVVGSGSRTLETLVIQLIGLTDTEWTATFLSSNSHSVDGKHMG
jgi:hypothetical protein